MLNIRPFRTSAAAIALLLCANVHAVVIDFDSAPPGTPVTTIDGVTFSSNIGLDLIVSDLFDAASGGNYLGVDDGGFELFLPFYGDIITLDFATAIGSLSVSCVTMPSPPAGTFTPFTASGNAVSLAVPDAVLGDGGEVFVVTRTSLWRSLPPSSTAMTSPAMFSPSISMTSASETMSPPSPNPMATCRSEWVSGCCR
ncbi:MAG: hypothetical protein KDI68_09675 [Gammaproteobacteria bacterium]|nr:hypothetical protein [Gammaproteobacteria bacterium]